MSAKTELLRKIEEIESLPTLPAVVTKLSRALEDPDVNAEYIGKIIYDDPAMTAKILKVVNSSLYGLSQPVASISQAAALMGFKSVKNIALTASVFSTFDMEAQSRFNRKEFWKHSIIVGIAMNVLYDYVKKNIKSTYTSDILHLAGLVHGIGIIVFEQYFHVKFTFSMIFAAKENIQLSAAERNTLGADHCEIGAWLGSKWKLPPEVVAAIRWHEEPENAPAEFADLVNLCHTAKYICTLKKLGDYGDSVTSFKSEVWKALGLTMQEIGDIIDEILKRAEESETFIAIAK